MAYCVHCGVELASYEEVCPLCGTKVVDPNKSDRIDEKRFMEIIKEESQHVDTVFLAKLLTGIWAIPAIVTMIIDLATGGGINWSLYVVGGTLLLWVHIVVPIGVHFKNPVWYVILDFLATAGFLYLVAVLTGGTKSWYPHLGLPLVVLTAIESIIFAVVTVSKQTKIMKAGLYLFTLSFFIISINAIINLFVTGKSNATWGWYASIPLLAFGTALIIFSKSRKISDWIRKNLFI